MAQTDILNPTPTHPLNPDYGFQKKRPLTHLNAKANQGAPYFREITDVGHQFSLNWNDKLSSHARKLKWYYEQYRDGFFTLIDHAGGGRHYVGRFSQPVEPSPTGNNRWSVQQVLFDEVPGAPMLQYPSDWMNDAVWCGAVNDFGDRMVAAVSGTPGTLIASALAQSGFLFSIPPYSIVSYVYAGYGFEVWAPTGPGYGSNSVFLDGVNMGGINYNSAAPQPSSMLAQFQNVSLGVHTVSLQTYGAGQPTVFDALKVMC